MSEYLLIKKIIELSNSKNWDDAKKEWNLDDIRYDWSSCLCGKDPIRELCILKNNLNGNNTIVGNCCVNKFLSISNQNKIFTAIKKNKLNAELIDLAYKKQYLIPVEREFLMNNWRKRKMNLKNSNWFNNLKGRIINAYKNGKFR